MKNIIYLVFFSFVAINLTAQGPVYNNNDPGDPLNPDVGLVNSPGTGVGGTDESVVETPANFNWGFNNARADQNSIADDFTLATNTDITSILFYGFQTDAPPSPTTITGVYVRIWDGEPGMPGSSVVWGDLSTNLFASASFMDIYRVLDINSGMNTQRPVQEIEATVVTTLAAGSYWLEWQYEGDGMLSGPWTPPLTISGQPITGNAVQSLDNGVSYQPVLDSGSSASPKGFPFVIIGMEAAPIPTMGEWGIIILGLSLFILGTVAVTDRQRLVMVRA